MSAISYKITRIGFDRKSHFFCGLTETYVYMRRPYNKTPMAITKSNRRKFGYFTKFEHSYDGVVSTHSKKFVKVTI